MLQDILGVAFIMMMATYVPVALDTWVRLVHTHTHRERERGGGREGGDGSVEGVRKR